MTRRAGSTRLRLTVMLTLALLPLGLISVYQSWTMGQQAREMSERALLGETIRAAAAQREVLQTAIGQAGALAHLVRPHVDDMEACRSLLRRFVEGAGAIRLASFVGTDGILDCASEGGRRDFSGTATFARAAAEGRLTVNATARGAITGEDVILISQPVRAAADEALLGFLVLSVQREKLTEGATIPGLRDWPLSLVTFNRDGQILSASGEVAGIEAKLPRDAGLAGFVGLPAHAFSAPAAGGAERVFSVVPILPGELYALGTWAPDALFGEGRTPALTLGLTLPILMWAVSLAVAYGAISGLVLRPVGALQTRIQAFTEGRRLLPPYRMDRAPDELRAVAESFETMTQRIISDEARLAKAVHDQEVLLKEVHHRVKNNLQLIASILNMQIRQQRRSGSRAVLRRVQDRVMGLATVHDHLYRSSALSTLRADSLVSTLVDRALARPDGPSEAIEVDTAYAPVQLYPDQAVPLALLVNEAMTNVLHHIGRPDGGAPWLRLRLAGAEEGQVRLEIANSLGTPLRPSDPDHSSGLGTQLIEAFATQLGGELARETDDDAHRLSVVFTVTGFGQDAAGPEPAPPGAHAQA